MKIAKSIKAVATIVAVGFAVSSCSASKVAQCNDLVAVANEAAEFGQEFGANPPDLEKEGGKAFTDAADTLDQLTAKIEAVTLQDETLKGYRTSFAEMYKALGKGLRDGAAAYDNKDVPAMEAAMVAIQESAEPESKLVDDVNAYCSGS